MRASPDVAGDVRSSTCSPVLLPSSKPPRTEQTRRELVAVVIGDLPHLRADLPMGPEHAGWNKWKGQDWPAIRSSESEGTGVADCKWSALLRRSFGGHHPSLYERRMVEAAGIEPAAGTHT